MRLLLGSLVALVPLSCGGGQAAPAKDPCADVELDVERVWSAEIRAEVLGKGGTVGGSSREVVATKMDDLARDWVMVRRAVCRDHFERAVITKEQYVARTECLDAILAEQRTLVASLRQGAGDDVAARLAAVSERVGTCGQR
jgi:hypothetical protein